MQILTYQVKNNQLAVIHSHAQNNPAKRIPLTGPSDPVIIPYKVIYRLSTTLYSIRTRIVGGK